MLSITTIQGASAYSQRVVLDGETFVLEFNWNGREGAWYMTVSDAEGVALLASRKLSTNSPVLGRFRFVVGLPKGEIYPIDLSNTLDYAGYADLGENRGVRLLYITAAEMGAL